MTTSSFVVGTMRLGAWGKRFDTNQWESFINECLTLNLVDFDHADIYGDHTTEADFGKVLKKKPSLRQKMRLTTKCGIRIPVKNRPQNLIKSYDSSPEHITSSVEASLSNLGTDYIDLLLLHRPDFLMDPEKIATCLQSLKSSGKVLNFGVSNFSPSQFEMLNTYIPIGNHQIEASIFHLEPFENGVIDQLMAKNIKPTAWSPLGGGNQALDEANGSLKTTIKGLCEKYQVNEGQLMLMWLLRHPANIIPVLGTSKLERLKEAVAIQNLKLASEDWYALYSSSKGEILP